VIEISFEPWGPFRARKRTEDIHSWLEKVAAASKSAFEAGMAGSPPGPGSAGRYPGIRTGALRGSIKTLVGGDRMEIGTNMPYSLFLRDGTSKMAKRKMSYEALKEGMAAVGRLQLWVEWTRG
jgi:hypothetical protein